MADFHGLRSCPEITYGQLIQPRLQSARTTVCSEDAYAWPSGGGRQDVDLYATLSHRGALRRGSQQLGVSLIAPLLPYLVSCEA